MMNGGQAMQSNPMEEIGNTYVCGGAFAPRVVLAHARAWRCPYTVFVLLI